MSSRRRVLILSLCFGLLTLIPYLVAYASAGGGRFAGFLFNPADGAAYLAKMRQGWEGRWLYSLAFTENPGPGALLFPWYLLLGHAAALARLPLIAGWQIARVCGGVFFLCVLWEFLGRIGLDGRYRGLTWAVAALGSGLGWLALPAGGITTDLWVSEYIPLYGMLTSAHFPLATALILLLALLVALAPEGPLRWKAPAALGVGFALGAIQPFAILPVGLALAAWILLRRLSTRRFPAGSIAALAVAGAGALPWVIYDLWAVGSSPQLASWYAQNQTPTAPAWDIALSLGLPGAVCLIALVQWIRKSGGVAEKIRAVPPATLFLWLWLIINLALLFLPFSLQRRLMLGMWIPLAAIAGPRIARWIFRPAPSFSRILAAILLLAPSSLFFILALFSGILQKNPLLIFPRDESAAVDWIAAHASQDAVVLAPAGTSTWLPGTTGVRVVYGHPMETPFAAQALSDVETFYATSDPAAASGILRRHSVGFYLCSEGERVCDQGFVSDFQLAFSTGTVRIYSR